MFFVCVFCIERNVDRSNEKSEVCEYSTWYVDDIMKSK